MKTRSLFQFLLLVVFLSCQENEEPDPLNKMTGRWEQVYDVFDQYETYNVFEFKTDGTFHWEGSARHLETGETLGFRGIADGSFQIQDDIIFITEEVSFGRDYDDPTFIADNIFFSKEDLVPYESTPEISYRIVNDFSELRFICPKIADIDCTEFTTYIKLTD